MTTYQGFNPLPVNNIKEYTNMGIMYRAVLGCVVFFAVLSSYAAPISPQGQMGYVDMTKLFNDSAFIQKANYKLQKHIIAVETELKAKQAQLKKVIQTYQKSKKVELLDEIKSKQDELTQQTQAYKTKIKEEQQEGLQKFSEIVHQAIEKVAKAKHLSAILNSNSVVFSDNSQLINITNDVVDEMGKN